MTEKEINYMCALCSHNRYVTIDLNYHNKKITASPNGLVSYSDIHPCMDGLLSIINLHVDSNFDVRSFSMMELPEEKKSPASLTGVPMPTAKTANVYNITKISDKDSYRMILKDKTLKIVMNIGEVDVNSEEIVKSIKSEKELVQIDYYPSNLPRRYNYDWFKELVDALEQLPPTRLGLFITSLRYVQSQSDRVPNEFTVEQLRTILSSHKIKMDLLTKKGRHRKIKNLTNKYGTDKRSFVDLILQTLEEHPDMTLQDLQIDLKKDLVDLIFMLLAMENELILELNRDYN